MKQSNQMAEAIKKIQQVRDSMGKLRNERNSQKMAELI